MSERGVIVANRILTGILALFLVLGVATAIDYFTDYQSFRFGSSLGWRYMTATHYIGAFTTEILLAAAGLVAGFMPSVAERTLLIVRVPIVALLTTIVLS